MTDTFRQYTLTIGTGLGDSEMKCLRKRYEAGHDGPPATDEQILIWAAEKALENEIESACDEFGHDIDR